VEDACDCVQCGTRRLSFWQDAVGQLLSYLTEPRPWANKIIDSAYNAKAFDLHFILIRAILLKWKPDRNMKGLKIMCMKMEYLEFSDSMSFLLFPLGRLPEAFDVTVAKSWYPHYFNTEDNIDYIGPLPDVSYYVVNEMGEGERNEFLEWYGKQEPPFDNRRMLEQYCQDDVTVLRLACRVFRREFIQIGNLDVFLESITIASACNKVLRTRFLQPDTIVLILLEGTRVTKTTVRR